MKKICALSVLIILIMCIAVPMASAITDYRYYTKVNITNTTAADITGRYVIDINSSAMVTSGFMQADADDARIDPELDLMYGTLTDGTGTFTGSPIKLAINNTITCTVAGTATIVLPQSATGTVTSGTMTVTGSPVALVAGSNTITTTGAVGNFTVDVVYHNYDKASTFGELTNTSAYWYTDYITVPAYGTVTRYIWTGNTGATTRDQCWVASDADTNTVADDATLDITDDLTVSSDICVSSLPGSEKRVVSKKGNFEIFLDGVNVGFRVWKAGAAGSTLNVYPDANGTLNQSPVIVGGAAWQAVSDSNDATYIASNTDSGHSLTDRFYVDASAINEGVIVNSVTVYIRFGNVTGCAGGGYWSFAPLVYLSGSTTTGTGQDCAVALTWYNYNESLVRPGGGSWTREDLDNMEIGVQNVLSGCGPARGHVSEVYAVVNYDDIDGGHEVTLPATTGTWVNIEGNYDTGNAGAELRIRQNGGAWTTAAVGGTLFTNIEPVHIAELDGKVDNTVIQDTGVDVLNLEYEATQITGAAAVTTVEDQSASTNDMSSTRDGNPAGITVTLNGTLPATYSVPPASVTSLTNDSTKEINQPDYIGTEQGNTFDDSNVPGLIVNTASDVSGIETQWIWWFIYGLICIMLLLVGFSLGGHITIGWFMVIIGTALFVSWGPIPWWFIPVDVIFMIGTLSWENRTTM